MVMMGNNHPWKSRPGGRHDLDHGATDDSRGVRDLALLRLPWVFRDLRPVSLQRTRLLVRVQGSGMFMACAPLSLTNRVRAYKYDAKRSLV